MQSGLNKFILRSSLSKNLPNSIINRKTKVPAQEVTVHFMEKLVRRIFRPFTVRTRLKYVNIDELKELSSKR